MHQGQYVFSQVMDSVVRHRFNQCVARYGGEYRVREFSCWEQFLAMSFGHLSFRESLRDIIICLTAQHEKLYHLGFRTVVRRSTLSDANEARDWRIYRDYALILIQETRSIYVDDTSFTLDLEGTVFVVDSTTIEMCLNIFPWARYAKKQAAIKLQYGIGFKRQYPCIFRFFQCKRE